MGQCTYLVCYDCKASSLLSRPRCFDRRVERKQVCLLCYCTDYTENFTNVLSLSGEVLNLLCRELNLAGQRTNGLQGLVNALIS